MTLPVIRLEIQGMKYAVQHAMAQHIAQMDSDIQSAVNEICTEENIKDIIKKTAKNEIDQAIKNEIEKFYRYGCGRDAIKQAVELTLKETK